MLLSHYELVRKNNIDVLRLIFAVMVLVGHVFPIAGAPSGSVPLSWLLKSTWLGTLAVNGFFVFSGFLVSASYVHHGIFGYAVSRIFRIYPALIVCMTATVGTMFFYSHLNANDYFFHNDTWDYFWHNVTLNSARFTLPTVNTVNGEFVKYHSTVNGTIWSLFLEVRLYIFVAVLGLFGFYRNRIMANIAFGSLLLISYVDIRWIPMMVNDPLWASASKYFYVGALLYLNRDMIVIDGKIAALCGAAFLYFQGFSYFEYVAVIPFCYAVFWLGFCTPHIPVKKYIGDLSYAIFLYGWPVAAILIVTFPESGPYKIAFLTLCVALIIASVSWRFIERPALGLKDRYFDFGETWLRQLGSKLFDAKAA